MSRRSENRIVRCYHGCETEHDTSLELEKPRKCPGLLCNRYVAFIFSFDIYFILLLCVVIILLFSSYLPYNCWQGYHRCGEAGCICQCTKCKTTLICKSSTIYQY
jgi:hypothetical protein